ncbi:MAG: phosphodiester glycosidase family protein, partial [Methylobacteriaceae bacterium]|nr:phosphodiester glycosidase family protein [Methylobacteriaceae bacterium]
MCILDHFAENAKQVCQAAAVALLSLLSWCGVAAAAPEQGCTPLVHKERAFIVCSFDITKDAVRLFLRSAEGELYGSFDRLAADLARSGSELTFAMNAGMYDPGREPVGMYVEGGKLLHAASTRDGEGNFHLKPNGIFWVGRGTAGVTETRHFLARPPNALYATQSGPMLVIAGRIHPKIHPEGTSRKLRNGVGVSGHFVRFAISDEPVTFYEFASLFRDRLNCPEALFLDGSISS